MSAVHYTQKDTVPSDMIQKDRVMEIRQVDLRNYLIRSFLASLLKIRLLVRTEYFLFGNISAPVSLRSMKPPSLSPNSAVDVGQL